MHCHYYFGKVKLMYKCRHRSCGYVT